MTIDPVAPSRRRRRLLTACATITIAIPIAVVGVVIGVALVLSLLVAVGLGLASTSLLSSRAQPAVLAVTGARELREDESPRLSGLVEGLCLTSGVTIPALLAIDSITPNALIARQGDERASLIVTTGLLRSLSRIELEGVVAHLLARLKRREVRVATAAVLLASGPVYATERSGAAASIVATALRPVRPLASRLRLGVCPPAAIIHADVDGVGLTRYPPGLIAALERIAEAPAGPLPGSLSTAQLWLVEPAVAAGSSASGTHPPLDQRIALMREL
jgi:heat shock protein HtpX